MKLFISYSSKDIEIVKKVCEYLKDNNFDYWVAHENEDFGDHYATTIIKQISDASIFVVFVSKSSNLSTHVINEINSAVMRDKVIIPIVLDNIKMSPAMEYYLASNHYITYSEDVAFFAHFTNRIRSLMGKDDSRDSAEVMSGVNDSPLLERANSGDVDAMCEVGRCYYTGKDGFAKDLELAFLFFEKAAKAGHPEAQCNVGWCYEVGDGVEEDLSKAFEWYAKSAENGCSMAQYSLGWMYENGVFVSKNHAKAMKWFVSAAEQGHAMSQYKLGLAYHSGSGVDQNDVIANHWLMLAADQGVVFAQYQLAKNYYHGTGCKRDIIKAKRMWLLSAEKGYIKSAEALEKYYDIHYLDDNKGFLV